MKKLTRPGEEPMARRDEDERLVFRLPTGILIQHDGAVYFFEKRLILGYE